MLILLTLLTSCTREDLPPPPDFSSVETTENTENSGPQTPDPALTAEEVAARIEDALLLGWPAPATLRDTYLSALAEGDPDCPGDPELMISAATAMEGCLADSGWRYSGTALYWDSGDPDTGPVSTWSLTVDIRLTDPAGDIFSAGGGVNHRLEYGVADERRYLLTLYGSWQYTGTPDWLGAGMSADLIAEGGWNDSDGWHTISGGLGVSDTDLFFDEFAVGMADCGSLQGTLMLHDTTGYWYEVSLDCDRCGPLRYAGQPMSELCLDVDLIESVLTEGMSSL